MSEAKFFESKPRSSSDSFLFPSHRLTYLKSLFLFVFEVKIFQRGIICGFLTEGNLPPPENTCFKIFSGKCEQFFDKSISIHEQ